MEMTEVFDKLKNLQNVLVEKYDLEQKIDKSPKQLDTQNGFLARLKEEYIEKNKSYEEAKAKVDALRAELSGVEATREAAEKDMDSVTNHREYEALDKQIKESKDKEEEIRRNLKDEEEVLARLDEALKGDESMISTQEAELNQNKEALDKEIQEYKDQLAELSKQEEEIVPGLDQEIVYKFQRIIQRNSEGIVAVKNGVCTGCHMILPGQFANEVHDGEKILFCPYCSRILFHQDVAEGEVEEYSTLDETGSLADFDDEFADEYEDSEAVNNDEDGDMDDEKSLSFED
ncbi:MAG: nucleic acid-binding protein [Treponema sp.]|nr:nucleic acid-binding protein [Candidatus Treponema equifaecale]